MSPGRAAGALTLFLCFAVPGCSSVYRTPGSEALKPSEIAVIDHPNPTGKGIVIEQVDGAWRGMGRIERYELTPGQHSITVALNTPGYSGGKITRWFQARAGRVYVVDAIMDKTAMRWTISIIDRELGQRVDYSKPFRQ